MNTRRGRPRKHATILSVLMEQQVWDDLHIAKRVGSSVAAVETWRLGKARPEPASDKERKLWVIFSRFVSPGRLFDAPDDIVCELEASLDDDDLFHDGAVLRQGYVGSEDASW